MNVKTLCMQNKLLSHVVRQLWSVVNFRKDYEAYLQGSLSEEAFLQVCREKHSVEWVSVSPDEIEEAVCLLLKVCEDTYDIGLVDLTDMLNVGPFQILEVVKESNRIPKSFFQKIEESLS